MKLTRSLQRIREIGVGPVLEAVFELLRARVLTLLPARVYLADFKPNLPKSTAPQTQICVSVTDIQKAERVGQLVEALARRMPFRALCLQQAIASCRMLRRRNLPAKLSLGLNKSPRVRKTPEQGTSAHAWVSVGERVVCGSQGLVDFVEVAGFHNRVVTAALEDKVRSTYKRN